MKFAGKYLFGALAVAVLVAAMPVAQADDDEDEVRRPTASSAKISKLKVSNPKWRSECGACHFAYPPRFLPAESWRELMSGLDKHFGSNASLDAESALEITAFLEEHARRKSTSRDSSGKYPLRITEMRWFMREHDEVSSRVRSNPAVKSLANCAVCHIQAELGDFSERNINIPK